MEEDEGEKEKGPASGEDEGMVVMRGDLANEWEGWVRVSLDDEARRGEGAMGDVAAGGRLGCGEGDVDVSTSSGRVPLEAGPKPVYEACMRLSASERPDLVVGWELEGRGKRGVVLARKEEEPRVRGAESDGRESMRETKAASSASASRALLAAERMLCCRAQSQQRRQKIESERRSGRDRTLTSGNSPLSLRNLHFLRRSPSSLSARPPLAAS